jgi:hypothetical protein
MAGLPRPANFFALLVGRYGDAALSCSRVARSAAKSSAQRHRNPITGIRN